MNVPNGVWIDEDGMIVRPAEQAHPGPNPANDSFRKIDLSTVPPEIADVLVEARKIRAEPELYLEMVHDWVEHGAASRYAHTPDEVDRPVATAHRRRGDGGGRVRSRSAPAPQR